MHLNGPAYLPGTEASGATVRVDEPASGVRILTLNRPHRLNAMPGELICDLHQAIDDVAADDSCRVVVLTGAGGGFCAGLDLKERPSRRPRTAGTSPQSRMHVQQAIASLVPKLRNLRQPVIAAVNGPGPVAASPWHWPWTSGSRRPRRSSMRPSSASACPAAISARAGCSRA